LENFILEQANKRILAGRPAEQKPIGQDICNWLSRVTKNSKKNTNVINILGRVVGEEIMQHCSCESIRSGVLKIRVKPGPYMFHLRNMTGEILKILQEEYPSSKIKEIKLIAK